MKNGRCRLHGGKSTGPKTLEALLRIKKSKTKHSYYSKVAIQERKNIRNLISKSKEYLQNL